MLVWSGCILNGHVTMKMPNAAMLRVCSKTGAAAAGTSIALLGTYLYTEATKRYKHAPKETPPSSNAVA